jgi:predicted SprT family Zn-dependent metalloprotease
VLDTILHEIAHALAGHKAGHGPAWKAKCAQIGAKPKRCFGREIKMPDGRWRAVCGGCRKLFSQHRKPKAATATSYFYCKLCGPRRGRLDYYRAESTED